MAILRRAQDRPERSRGTISRRAALKTFAATGLGVVGGTGVYGYAYGRHDLQVTRANVPVDRLPAALRGLRIGLITDIHRSHWVSHDDVAHAVAALMAERPDLIVLGGDYVTWGDNDYVGAASDALSPLSAPLGVFAILGNHDNDHDMPPALALHGIQVLRDARTRLTVRDEPLDLVGIRFWTRRASDIARLSRGSAPATILLAHDPRRLVEAAELSIPLVLSGHTHGGQVVLPLVGAIAAQKFPVVAGFGRRERTTVFVSRGVGTIYLPVRVNCPPEVAVLSLEPLA
jgi:predicted MPP superfamily phosphohydrolase